MKYRLFTTKTCHNCPPAKEWAKENLDDCEILSPDTDDNAMTQAVGLNIKQVPTFADEEGNTYSLVEMKERVRNNV